MLDYKSLCLAIMICATMVNTQARIQTHRQAAFDRLYWATN